MINNNQHRVTDPLSRLLLLLFGVLLGHHLAVEFLRLGCTDVLFLLEFLQKHLQSHQCFWLRVLCLAWLPRFLAFTNSNWVPFLPNHDSVTMIYPIISFTVQLAALLISSFDFCFSILHYHLSSLVFNFLVTAWLIRVLKCQNWPPQNQNTELQDAKKLTSM